MANLSCNCIPAVLFPDSSANAIHPSGQEDGSNIRLFHKKHISTNWSFVLINHAPYLNAINLLDCPPSSAARQPNLV
ncbi:hypothetical protein [Thiolapillus sp.]